MTLSAANRFPFSPKPGEGLTSDLLHAADFFRIDAKRFKGHEVGATEHFVDIVFRKGQAGMKFARNRDGNGARGILQFLNFRIGRLDEVARQLHIFVSLDVLLRSGNGFKGNKGVIDRDFGRGGRHHGDEGGAENRFTEHDWFFHELSLSAGEGL